jgi:hypothetical protein
VTTIAVTGFGILTWILIAILLALFLTRANRINRLDKLAVNPTAEPTVEAMVGFPVRPKRFVGRAEMMAAAGSVLDSVSGRTALVFHGTAGAGKTACAVELAYRHRGTFDLLVFWSAPPDPDQSGDALRLLALELEARLGSYGFTLVDEITTPQRLQSFLPTLTAAFADAGALLVLDNLETLLTPDGRWRDPRWALLIGALTDHQGPSRAVLTGRDVPAGLNPDVTLSRWPARRSSTPAGPGSGPGPNSAIKACGSRYSTCSASTSKSSPTYPRCAPRWPNCPTSAPTTTA